ncbi:MAG: hypothetical protein GTO02_17410 [Candidatus Dadabacteria bacterium]|nr:hypothetical protein [Candidatus Dadabacteria bacterium]
MIYHSQNIVVLHYIILGFTRSADTISLDYFINRYLYNRKNSHSDSFKKIYSIAPSWHYGWPIKLILAVTTSTYLLAGIAKILGPLGFSWFFGESVRSQIAVDAIRKEILSNGAKPLAYILYNKVYLFTFIGVSTLVLELGAPFAMLNKRLGYLWSISTFLMHWGIYFIMGINFRYQMLGIVFLPFFDIEKIYIKLKSKLFE